MIILIMKMKFDLIVNRFNGCELALSVRGLLNLYLPLFLNINRAILENDSERDS